MTESERKENTRKTFNIVSEGYDKPALRFFSESAKYLTKYLHLTGDEKVLDIATGTGNVALNIAHHLPKGHITGIDLSPGMLNQATLKANKLGLNNTTFTEMDMQNLDFPDHLFDKASIAFGIFFVEDMQGTLKAISKKIRSEGRITISTFNKGSFSPLTELCKARLENHGLEIPKTSWARLDSPDLNEQLFKDAGLKNIQVHKHDIGYHLENAEEWWDILWNAGYRGFLNQLSEDQLKDFKENHLNEIQKCQDDKGIKLSLEIIYTTGTVA